MTAPTPFQHLLGTKAPLARLLNTNNEVCGVLAALLGRLVIEASRKGVPITGVQMGPLRSTGDGQFMSRVSYNYSPMILPVGVAPKGSLEDYLADKGIQLAKVLAMNHSVGTLFEALTEKIVNYAKTKGVQFSDVWVYNEGAFISKDDEMVVKVGVGQKPYKLKEIASDIQAPHPR